MKFEYPIKTSDNNVHIMGSNNVAGCFPIGRLNCWHGGVHVEATQQEAIRCIADGYVVAYRMPTDYITQNIDGKNISYSNGFVLVQHHYESPNKKQKLVFYSLYMHLLPKQKYLATQGIPFFMSKKKYRVKKNATRSINGLMLYQQDDSKTSKFMIPFGTKVSVSAKTYVAEKYLKDMEYREVSYEIYDRIETGYMATASKYATKDPKNDNYYTVTYNTGNGKSAPGALLYEEKDVKSKIIDVIPEGTVFEKKQGANSEFINVKSQKANTVGYIDVKQLEILQEWSVVADKVVNCKIPVRAGDMLGFCGNYGSVERSQYLISHIEVFTEDDSALLKDFLSNKHEDGIENKIVKNPFVKLPKELSLSFSYLFNEETWVTPVSAANAAGYRKVKIGNMRKLVDKSKLEYSGSRYTYTAKENLEGFKGLAVKGTKFAITKEINDRIEEKKKKEDGTTEDNKLRHFECADYLTGDSVWVKSSDIKTKELNDITEGAVCAKGGEPKGLELKKETAYVLTGNVMIYYKEPQAAQATKVDLGVYAVRKKKDIWKTFKQNGKEYCYDKFSFYKKDKDPAKDGQLVSVEGFFEKPSKEFPAYNWNEFGFQHKKESIEQDRYYFDYDRSSPFIKMLIEKIDTDDNRELSESEIKRALYNKRIIRELSRYVCCHRSEWSYNGFWGNLWKEVEDLYDKLINARKDEKSKVALQKDKKKKIEALEEQVKKLAFWNEIQIDTSKDDKGFALTAFPKKPYVFHFNPIAFVEQMKKMEVTSWHDPVDNPQITIYTQSGHEKPWRSSFGYTRKDISANHHGLDIFALKGTNIYACLDATVVGVENQGGYGKILILKIKNVNDFHESRLDYKLYYKTNGEYEGISKSNDVYLRYAHLDTITVKDGQDVISGMILGTTGTTGVKGGTCGPHLHFEISSCKYPKSFSDRYNPGYYVVYKMEQMMSNDEKEIQKKRKDEGKK